MAITIQGVKRKDRNTVENTGGDVTAVKAVGTGLAPVPTVSDGAGITHGRQITSSNTGHTAYFDSGLGRTVVDGDLTVHSGAVSLSSLGIANGGTISKRWFQDGLSIDRTGVTIRACKFEGGVSGYVGGTHRAFTLDYCTIDTSGAAGDDGIHYQDYTANRCRIGGHSDGAKINGNCTLTECYIRTEGQDSGDHNDGLQANTSYAGSTVRRCNIDCRPTNGIGGANAALFAADSSTGLMIWQDNWLAGGGYVIRCYEDCTYQVDGNDILDGSYGFGAVHRAVIPQGNLTSWTNNRRVDGSGNFVANVSIP